MPAFNDWVRGSCLQAPTERRAVSVAWNLLYHAAVLQRCQLAALQGRYLSVQDDLLRPLTDTELQERLQGAI
jgi:hypothetical protein